MNTDISVIKFDVNGLVPVITQEVNGQVLMLAYMNKEAIEKTIETGFAWYYSRKRKSLWKKGETSGNIQYVQDILYDCDGDAILLRVKQRGVSCHTGTYSCFSGRGLFSPNDKSIVPLDPLEHGEDVSLTKILSDLYEIIQSRRLHPVEGSYTNYLFDKGQDKILKKVGEEATETIIASKNNIREDVLYEMGDLWYHCLILLAYHNMTPEDLLEELLRRRCGNNYHKFTGKTGIRPNI